jgi:hypothetical protein
LCRPSKQFVLSQFEEVVWPAYAATLARVKSRFPSADCQQDVNNRLLVFHDVSRAFLAVDELLLIVRR